MGRTCVTTGHRRRWRLGRSPIFPDQPPRLARRPAGAQPGAAGRTGRGDPNLPGAEDVNPRRSSRPEPGDRRAHHGVAPGLRFAGRPDHLRHRAPGLRPQDRHRPGRRLRQVAHQERPVRLPESDRVGARLGGEFARVDLAGLRRRFGEGLRPARRTRPHRRGRHRRRRADRWHGLGGAEQHRSRQGPTAGGGVERQRAVVRADHRWHGAADGVPAAATRLRTVPRPGQEPAAPGPGHRAPVVLGVARLEVGHEGLAASTDHVPGPRAEVPRSDRRSRHPCAGGRRCATPRATADRCWCTASPARVRATHRPRTTTPNRCTRRPPSIRTPGCPSRRRPIPGPACSAAHWSRSARFARMSWRSPRP